MKALTASNLKTTLWETLNNLKSGNMQADQANAVAVQGREILRTVKLQLQVAAQAKRDIPLDVIEFAEK